MSDRVMTQLQAVFGEAIREGQRRAAKDLSWPTLRLATVVDIDTDTGIIEVHLDADPLDVTVGAIDAGGMTLQIGGRCLVVFGGRGACFAIGAIGARQLILPMTGDVSLASSTHPFQIGDSEALNVIFDNNEIQARDGSNPGDEAAVLSLNASGGRVDLAGTASIGPINGSALDGNLYLARKAMFNNSDFALAQTTDGRTVINHVVGEHTEIREGNATSPALLRIRRTGIFPLLTTELTIPEDFPTLGGTTALGMVPGTGQIGYVSSSERYKTDIATFDGATAIAKLNALRPVAFRYKLHEGVHPDGHEAHVTPNLGFIAEEVAEIIPEAVTFDGDGNAHSVDLAAICAVLVAANQELVARVEALEKRLKAK